jgi:SRSO17 transposase
MKYPVTPQKKGAFVQGLTNRFIGFCKVYSSFFNVFSDNVCEQARCYLAGLMMKSPRKNMERMEEYVSDCEYQQLQQFLTDSPWDDRALQDQIGKDVNACLGGEDSFLALDDSGFTKKGDKSVGVARQWNGRLGKVDNCQVGVFAALVKGRQGSLIDKRLYLPEHWVADAQRCKAAGIPEEQRVFQTKIQLALDMVDCALANGVSFGYVGGDGFYGNTPRFARELHQRSLTFLLDVHKDQTIYLRDPKPYLPRRKKRIGPKYKNLQSRVEGVTAESIAESVEPREFQKVEIRESTKGTIALKAWRCRVWLWDGEEKDPKQWWLVITKNVKDKEMKAFISNADEEISLAKIVRIHAQRFWIERCFEDAKTSMGMADYQARKWNSWNHHMCLVTLAMLFMLKERLAQSEEIMMLSCQDIVELLNFYLPRADLSEEAVLRNIERRQTKRIRAIENAYKKQGKSLETYFDQG